MKKKQKKQKQKNTTVLSFPFVFPIVLHRHQPTSSHSPHLLYKVKSHYVQISNIVDTSIKQQISGQSSTMVKGCMNIIMFDMLDTAFEY